MGSWANKFVWLTAVGVAALVLVGLAVAPALWRDEPPDDRKALRDGVIEGAVADIIARARRDPRQSPRQRMPKTVPAPKMASRPVAGDEGGEDGVRVPSERWMEADAMNGR